MSTNVANVVSHFPDVENGFTTTLASTISSGATTVPLNSVAGYTNGLPAVFVVDPSDTNKKQTFTGIIDTSGVQLTNVVWTAGTNQAHSGGATVVDYATATHIAMMSKGITKSLGQDGHIATTGVATFTDNLDVASGKAIRDGNDNELLKFAQTASAVNELTLTNAATTGAPELSATGGDTNIDIKVTPKGTGNVKKGSNNIDWWEEIGRTVLSVAGDTITVSGIPARKYIRFNFILLATGGTISCTFRLNNDSGSNYSYRSSSNGAADSSTTSASSIVVVGADSDPKVFASSAINLSTTQKFITGLLASGSSSAAAAPGKTDFAGKWANTADQITRVDVINTGTGDFAIGSEVVVLGHD